MYVIFGFEQGVELAIEEGVQPRPCYVCMVRWEKRVVAWGDSRCMKLRLFE